MQYAVYNISWKTPWKVKGVELEQYTTMIDLKALVIIIRPSSFHKMDILTELCTDWRIREIIACIRNVISLIKIIVTLSSDYVYLTRPVGIF